MSDSTSGGPSGAAATPASNAVPSYPVGSTTAASANSAESSSGGSSGRYRPQTRFSFPAAAQPEIVRACQKDTYYRDLFTSQLQDVVRALFGTRTVHSHVSTISLAGSLSYYVLSTSSLQPRSGRGGQTLGEEYVNTIPVGRGGRVVTSARRSAFIVLHVLAPFAASKMYAMFRRIAVRNTEAWEQSDARAAARARALDRIFTPSFPLRRRLLAWIAARLPSIEDLSSQDGWLAYLSASHLMLFYLGGKFYSFAQRLTGIRYISTIPKPQSYRPPSYEVLGFLLAVQLSVKFVMAILDFRRTARSVKSSSEGAAEKPEQDSSASTTTVEIDTKRFDLSVQPPKAVSASSTSTSWKGQFQLLYPRLPDDDESNGYSTKEKDSDSITVAKLNTDAAQNNANSTLQCTLCMDRRNPHSSTSAVTECGHCFDWDCITAWAREKPECPLCRQRLQLHKILPLYNF
ncbi:hypothetical protein BCV70DRAFT_198452 [Testicularia cyperi]|uniref:RING-type E3 ubiquitin transferase n=1 Tax=Testicularia cyperi TaxID=1882483 RepID=A0A317XW78_9BASI|nr:hypothetical protein BCV70DRAFT_198452 [Testicularia cyperi]